MEKEKSKNEKYVEKWFHANGFKILTIKSYISKTKYTIERDEVSDLFELPYSVADIKKYMKLYDESFKMKTEIQRMKSELNK